MEKLGLGQLVVLLLLSACTQSERRESLRILQAQMLELDCTPAASPTAPQRTSGTLDVALPDMLRPYRLPLLLANGLEPSGGSTSFDENDVTVTGFSVALSAPSVTWSNACPATFDTPGPTYRLAPGTTAGLLLDVLSASHSQCLRPVVEDVPLTVTATIRAQGFHRGDAVTSAPFIFSIKVCAGCLQQGYADPILRAYEYPRDIPVCESLYGMNPYPGDPCAPGQDSPILCCAEGTTVNGAATFEFVCPGVFNGSPVPDASAPIDG